jgi:DNA-binding Lrp family transcriptional regulator
VASPTLDQLDRRIIHALYVDGRASFSRLAEVLGTSEQTVARRYGQLHHAGAVRVVGLLNSQRLGQSDWVVRIRCTPDAAMPVATALARRADTAWVQLTSGGTEIFCTIKSHDERDRAALLLEQLPSRRQIVTVEAHWLLHLFTPSPSPVPGASVLTSDEVDQLEATPAGHRDRGPVRTVQNDDWPLLRALAEDGRATYRQLATRTHWHESTVRRRLEDLATSGTLYFDLDVAPELLGVGARAILWMSVAPAHLMKAGQTLANHPEVPFAAATTGSTNLVASLACSDPYALFDYLTREIATLEGVTAMETAPIMRSIKRHATMVPAS